MNSSNQLRHLVRLLIFINIAIPHPSHSRSKLYDHKSTRLLPVSGLLMAVLLLKMTMPTVGKSKCLHCQMCHVFMAWETPGHLASWSIFCGKWGQGSKIHKTRTLQGKLEQIGCLLWRYICGNNRESAQASSAVAVTIVEITIYTEMSNCIVIVTVILWFVIVSATWNENVEWK